MSDRSEASINKRLAAQGNPWRYDEKNFLLVLDKPSYGIRLAECRTSAEVLDWIAQVGGKVGWGDDVVAGLVRALDMLFHLQASLCGQGKELGPVDWKTQFGIK